MIKNITNKVFAIAASLTILTTSQSLANENIRPYIGLGYQMSNLDYKTESGVDYGEYAESDLSNINLFAGAKIEEIRTSIELLYFKSSKEVKSINLPLAAGGSAYTNSRVQLEQIEINGIYHQKTQDSKINFLFLGGLSKISFDAPLDDGYYIIGVPANQDGYGINLGLGLEAEIAQNVFIRGLAKYSRVNSIDYFDNLTTFSIGARYQF